MVRELERADRGREEGKRGVDVRPEPRKGSFRFGPEGILQSVSGPKIASARAMGPDHPDQPLADDIAERKRQVSRYFLNEDGQNEVQRLPEDNPPKTETLKRDARTSGGTLTPSSMTWHRKDA